MDISTISKNDQGPQESLGSAPPIPNPTSQNGSASKSSQLASEGIRQNDYHLTLSFEAIRLQSSSDSLSSTTNGGGSAGVSDIPAVYNPVSNWTVGSRQQNSGNTSIGNGEEIARVFPVQSGDGAATPSGQPTSLSALLGQILNGSSTTDTLTRTLSAFLQPDENDPSSTDNPGGTRTTPSPQDQNAPHPPSADISPHLLQEMEQQYAQSGGSKPEFVNTLLTTLSQGQPDLSG